jgi:PAS domain S-box-containing protein
MRASDAALGLALVGLLVALGLVWAGRRRPQAILHSAVDGVLTVDESGDVLQSNPAAVRMFGEGLLGQDVRVFLPDLVPHEGRSGPISSGLRMGKLRAHIEAREVLGRRLTGEVFPVEASIGEVERSSPPRFVVTLRDISRRRAAEDALGQTTDALRWLHDIASDERRTGDDKLEALLQMGRQRFGLPLGLLLRGDRVERGWGPEGRLPAGSPAPRELLRVVTAPVQPPEWVLCFAGPGEPVTLGETEQEILKLMARFVAGELARMEAARTLLELEHARNMELIGRLASGMAHDFKNLAMGVVGCADVALRRLEPAHPARQAVQEVRDVAGRSQELARQLLLVGQRPAPGGSGSFEVLPVLAALAGLLRPLLGPRVRLVLELQPLFGRLPGEASALERVILNLALNAREAMADGGQLVVSSRREGEHWKLVVSDTGHGMDEATRSQALSAGFSTRGSSGLGLSIVQRLVGQWGGRLELQSEPGRGSTFVVCAPLVQAVPAGARVLVVEDEPTVLRAMCDALEQAGMNVVGASSAEQAERALAGEVELLVTDLALPDGDGRQVAALARQRRPGLRVLYVSAQDLEEEALDAPLLRKPFDGQALSEQLVQLWA